MKAEYPDLTLLSNNSAAAYVMDEPPTGGPHFAPFDKKTLKKYQECIILWDPFSSNSIFTQTEVTKDNMLQDTTIKVVDKYSYWGADYFVMHRNNQDNPVK